MKELSLFDKFKILFDNILDHPLFIVLLFVPIVIFFLQKKHGKKVYVIVYFLVIISLLIVFGDEVFKLFDNVMNGLFMFLYFPNFITLFIVVLLCSIIAFVSIFSVDMHKINKIINLTSFGIVQMLFALILITVRTNKINIYKENALYSNNDVLTLMQILIGTFALQIISIIIINLINKATDILDKKDGSLSESIALQVTDLRNSKKIKTVYIESDKVGFINVADKKTTSKPKLKPFKFDLEKIKAITIDNIIPSKSYKKVNLNNNIFTYFNEVINDKKYKTFRLNSSRIVNLNSYSKDSLFKKVLLKSKPVKYLNENVKPYNKVNIESNNFIMNTKEKDYNKLDLNNEKFTYKNEVNKKYNKVDEAFDKPVKLNTPAKDYNKLDLNNEKFTYKNEVPEKPLFDFKNISANFKNIIKKLNIKPIKEEKIENLFDENEVILDDKKAVEPTSETHDIKPKEDNIFNEVFNMKPDIEISDTKKTKFIKPIPFNSIKPKEDTTGLIDNLNIIDIQSTLDTVVNFHLMKNVHLKGAGSVSVDNLVINNFDLLSKIINKYKLMK